MSRFVSKVFSGGIVMSLDMRIQNVFLGMSTSWSEDRRIRETARRVVEETQNHSIDSDYVRRILQGNGLL